jgi:hypothetical protein
MCRLITREGESCTGGRRDEKVRDCMIATTAWLGSLEMGFPFGFAASFLGGVVVNA